MSGLSESGVLLLVDPIKLYGQKGQTTMSIITDIFYGDTDMQDAYCKSEQYRTELKKLIDADEKLRAALTKEQLMLLNEAKEINNSLTNVIVEENFANGFRLGAKLMLEILLSDE